MKYKKRANKYIKKDLRMFFKFNKEYNKRTIKKIYNPIEKQYYKL